MRKGDDRPGMPTSVKSDGSKGKEREEGDGEGKGPTCWGAVYSAHQQGEDRVVVIPRIFARKAWELPIEGRPDHAWVPAITAVRPSCGTVPRTNRLQHNGKPISCRVLCAVVITISFEIRSQRRTMRFKAISTHQEEL